MTETEQSLTRDKQRVTIAKWFMAFFAVWIAAVVILLVCGVDLEPLLNFGFGIVTGGLMMKLGDILQFYFRTSGDKKGVKSETN